MRLSAEAVAIGKQCTHESHQRMRQSADAFLLGTDAWTPTVSGDERCIQGTCLRCRGTLSYPVRSIVAEQLLLKAHQ